MGKRSSSSSVDLVKVMKVLSKEVQNYQVPLMDLVKIQSNDPFRILIGTILSARTKDETTAKVLEGFFKKVKGMRDLSKLTEKQIEKLIYPVGFFRNKAKQLKHLPLVLEEEFSGVIPQTVDELVKLPGVGRKTANLVVALAFDLPAICVDIHVHRINNRLGYLSTKNPLETEMHLRKTVPKKYWRMINSVFVAFGQHLCRPVSPKCSICPVKKHCNQVGVTTTR